ncbi:MAG: ATP-binding cassette domain-containing protein [Bacteroidota bacterium]
MSILKLENVSVSFDGGKRYALKDFSLDLHQNQIIAIVGESGSGKTTILRTIAGLQKIVSGTISINKVVVSTPQKTLAPQKRKVSLVFQDFALFPHLTVAQNIGFGLKKLSDEKLQETLSRISLKGFEDRYPSELSGGQQQRIAIARSIVTDPLLLMMDEPFSNLDVLIRSQIRNWIIDWVKGTSTPLIINTHKLEDALYMADELVILQNGQLIEKGKPEVLFNQASHPYTRALFSNLKESAQLIINRFK